MNLADLSIKRPVFITCIFAVILIVGGLCFAKIGVDLFPNITFPVVVVTTVYPGAGPQEIETEVSKKLEDEISTLSGIKSVRSISKESISVVVAEFTQETDIKYATQQMRDRIALVKPTLPADAKDPLIRNVDPADMPIAVIGVSANLSPADLYDLTDERVRTKIEQVGEVGLVEIYGARKREIHVELDRKLLKRYEVAASNVSARIGASGKDIPAGKVISAGKETVIRSIAAFRSLADIAKTTINFMGNDVPVKVSDVGSIEDGLTEETSRTYINGQPAVFLYVYKQSGANTVAVFDGVKAAVDKLGSDLQNAPGKPQLTVVRDGAKPIKLNIADVKESILIGVLLTILVVYLFLGNLRSTFITGIALPNSLIGAFILLMVAGFTINVTSMLGLSLAVGLLIDDAIVVRENIFRHMEMGKSPLEAASVGTREVTLAVVATTLCIIAVFGPVAFIAGIIGKFLREFGLTVCFAMAISLFDSLTMGPMLSAYFGGLSHKRENIVYRYSLGMVLRGFDRLQEWLAVRYGSMLHRVVRMPVTIILLSLAIFGYSLYTAKNIPKNFMSALDTGDFTVDIDMPAGTTLDDMTTVTRKIEATLRGHAEIDTIVTRIGNENGESNVANFYVKMVPYGKRKVKTGPFKEAIRSELAVYAYANPAVKDATSMGGGGQRPFAVNIMGADLDELVKIADQLKGRLAQSPDLKDVDTSYRPGKPELQVRLNENKAYQYGMSSALVGSELRTLVEGSVPGVFRQRGREYDIRVRLKEEQRQIGQTFDSLFIPNINQNLVRLADVAEPINATGPATINRQDRGRYVQVSADLTTGGGGLAKAKDDVDRLFSSGEIKLPPGVRYQFYGQAESFGEMVSGILTATGLGIIFIYIVLASLYESFITPFTIMLVFPLAMSGGFIALYLTHQNLDMLAMIGCVMLLGLATKNSILLVDYANQLVLQGTDRVDAIIAAGRVRLRPILMTSIALITGMLPIAIGLSEVSSQRAPMGIAVIGGVISSTLLTLLVVPAVYTHIDRFRSASLRFMKRLFAVNESVTRES